MVDWEWYQDPLTFRVFLHLLITANHEERKWQGNTVLPGQKITSYAHLAEELRIGVQSVRTAINKLKATGELTYIGTPKYSLITILKWQEYQSGNKQTNFKVTSDQQSTNNQLTTNKNDKNVKNDKNNYGEFQNVLLSDEEYTTLCNALTEPILGTLIAELDEYIESKGVKYKSHRATIQTWARRRINDHAKSVQKNKTKIAFI